MQTPTLAQKLTAKISQLNAAPSAALVASAVRLLKANGLEVTPARRNMSPYYRAELVKSDLDIAAFNLRMAGLMEMVEAQTK